jgi:hypothetical protein
LPSLPVVESRVLNLVVRCSITPRDEKRVALINKIWAEKSQLLDENGQYKSIDNLG